MAASRVVAASPAVAAAAACGRLGELVLAVASSSGQQAVLRTGARATPSSPGERQQAGYASGADGATAAAPLQQRAAAAAVTAACGRGWPYAAVVLGSFAASQPRRSFAAAAGAAAAVAIADAAGVPWPWVDPARPQVLPHTVLRVRKQPEPLPQALKQLLVRLVAGRGHGGGRSGGRGGFTRTVGVG